MQTPLARLADRFQEMVKDLDVDPYFKRFHTSPLHDGAPHIEQRGGTFDFVITERGHELERRAGLEADEVLYLLMEEVTHAMATSRQTHVADGAGNAAAFALQEQLMAGFNPEWGARLKAEHERILQAPPLPR